MRLFLRFLKPIGAFCGVFLFSSLAVKTNPAEFAEKWGRRLKGSTQDIQRGVQRVSVAPTQKAIAKKDKMRTKLVEAIDNGKWEAGLNRVSLEDWRTDMLSKGIPRISAGVDGATRKMEVFASELIPHIERGQEMISRLPDVTLEDSITRMNEFVRHMAQFRRSR